MVRYSLAIAGTPAEGMLPVSLELYKIDIVEKNEQFTELYLCEVNPKGQVPVLDSPGYLNEKIKDSLDITFWLCDRYPSLRPAKHAKDIDSVKFADEQQIL